MANDVFDTYKLIVNDTNQLGNRRQTVDNVYEGIVTLILAADGYVVASGQFRGLLPIIATIAVSLVGIIFTAHWRGTVDKLKEVLRLRYEYLRKMESDENLTRIQAQVYTEENNRIYAKRDSARKKRGNSRTLQGIFTGIFIVLPLLQIALTVLAALPVTQPYIVPLIPPK